MPNYNTISYSDYIDSPTLDTRGVNDFLMVKNASKISIRLTIISKFYHRSKMSLLEHVDFRYFPVLLMLAYGRVLDRSAEGDTVAHAISDCDFPEK